jgi:hypothetical protein
MSFYTVLSKHTDQGFPLPCLDANDSYLRFMQMGKSDAPF